MKLNDQMIVSMNARESSFFFFRAKNLKFKCVKHIKRILHTDFS